MGLIVTRPFKVEAPPSGGSTTIWDMSYPPAGVYDNYLGDPYTIRKISGGGAWNNVRGTNGVTTGKYYWESKIIDPLAEGIGDTSFLCGAINAAAPNTDWLGATNNSFGYYALDGGVYKNGGWLGNPTVTYWVGDVVGIYLDLDTLSFSVYKNNAEIYASNPGNIPAGTWYPAVAILVDHNTTKQMWYGDFGQNPMTYTDYIAGGYSLLP